MKDLARDASGERKCEVEGTSGAETKWGHASLPWKSKKPECWSGVCKGEGNGKGPSGHRKDLALLWVTMGGH